MLKYADLLGSTTLFRDMDAVSIENIIKASGGVVSRFHKNDPLFMMAEKINKIAIILSGSVKIQAVDENGASVIVDILKEKDIFGEAYSYLNIKEIPVSVIANEDCEVLFLDNIKILSIGLGVESAEFKVIYNLVCNMSQKLFNLNQKLFMLQKITIREKLYIYFKQLAKQNGSKTFTLPMNKTMLSEYLGVNRTSLSRELANMIYENLIKMERNCITLLFLN